MLNVGINIGISPASGRKYDINNAITDWYGESLIYKYGGLNKMSRSSMYKCNACSTSHGISLLHYN